MHCPNLRETIISLLTYQRSVTRGSPPARLGSWCLSHVRQLAGVKHLIAAFSSTECGWEDWPRWPGLPRVQGRSAAQWSARGEVTNPECIQHACWSTNLNEKHANPILWMWTVGNFNQKNYWLHPSYMFDNYCEIYHRHGWYY